MSSERDSQIKCLQKLLKSSLDMIRICFLLPKIFQNLSRVRRRLKGSKYIGFSALIENYTTVENIESTHPNYNLMLKMIDYFYENTQLIDYFKDWLDDLEPWDKSLVDAFQLLQIVTDKRLNKPALFEIHKEKKIHEIYQENEKVKRNIKVLHSELKRKILCFKWRKAAEEVLIQKHEKDLAYCKYESNIRIKQEIIQSSCNIRNAHLASVVKQEELEGELQRLNKIYEDLMRENLKKEKTAQNKRNELLFYLENLIKKFDQTIGHKIKDHIHFKDEHEKQNVLFIEFLNVYHQEEAEYERVLQAKKEEEKHHHEQKILLFMMNRSARVIQKYWRKFRRAQKKASKKNKGRGKSKKK